MSSIAELLKDSMTDKKISDNLPIVKHTAYHQLPDDQYQFDVYNATTIYEELQKYFDQKGSMKGSTFSIVVDKDTIQKLCIPLTMYPAVYKPQLPDKHIHHTDLRVTVSGTKVYCDATTVEYIVY